jgi:flagellar hook-basal body complex protein FliE
MIRIDKPDFTITSTLPSQGKSTAKGLDFVDTLKETIDSTNKLAKESEKAALDLSSGKSANIHEAMIAMQKADISLRLLVKMTNEIISGYKELNQLR